MWIENVAAIDVTKRHHHEAGENSMLISITDPAGWRPEAMHTFKERHNFEFLDADSGFPEECLISDAQAAEIVRLLQHAQANNMNVVVHCTAGLCRSGAVAEVGVMMGFGDTERTRIPNIRVKHKMMKALGWTYDENEKPDDEAWRRMKLDF
jgi:protein-tyrosine phosphatase